MLSQCKVKTSVGIHKATESMPSFKVFPEWFSQRILWGIGAFVLLSHKHEVVACQGNLR